MFSNRINRLPSPSSYGRSPPIRIPSPTTSDMNDGRPWARNRSNFRAPSPTIHEEIEPQEEEEGFVRNYARAGEFQRGLARLNGRMNNGTDNNNNNRPDRRREDSRLLFKSVLIRAAEKNNTVKKCTCSDPTECKLIPYVPGLVYQFNLEPMFEMEFDEEELQHTPPEREIIPMWHNFGY